MLPDKIGIALGDLTSTSGLGPVALDVGARAARVRVRLGSHSEAGPDFVAAVASQLENLRAAGLRLIVELGSDLTVAPTGLGAFQSGDSPLAAVWVEEFTTNVRRVAEAAGGVAAWEVLPLPNAGDPVAIAPERFAALVAAAADVIRAVAPETSIISGGIQSGTASDGTAYLKRVLESWKEQGRGVPVEAVGVRLDILPDGGSGETAVAALVLERIRNVADLLEATNRRTRIVVTSVGWDADRAGEAAQARCLWAVYDALIGHPMVDAIVWRSLIDEEGQGFGLFRGDSVREADRRLAWNSLRDFSAYALQITPRPTLQSLLEPTSDRFEEAADDLARQDALDDKSASVEAPTEEPVAIEPALVERSVAESEVDEPGWSEPRTTEPEASEPDWPEPESSEPDWPEPELVEPVVIPPLPDLPREVEPVSMEPNFVEPVSMEPDFVEPDSVEPVAAQPRQHESEPEEPVAEPAPEPTAEPAAGLAEYQFRIPSPEELLRAQGLVGDRLEAALNAVDAKYGSHEWLPPGEYAVTTPGGFASGTLSSNLSGITNQAVITAFYRADEGSWDLFERSGLVLSELASHRNDPYQGPPVSGLSNLTEEERDAVARELSALKLE
jgi:hypothetical protein